MMDKFLKNNKGFTLIELIVCLVLITILGSIVMNILKNTYTLHNHSFKNYENKSEARIALSYVISNIRQNDVASSIEVKENKLIIKDKDKKQIKGIFFEDNKLKEETNENSVSNTIAKINSFEISKKDNLISVQVGYLNSIDNEKILKEQIVLRSFN